LEAEFGEAMRAYYAPYETVKTPEEAEKIKLDPAKNPQKLLAAKYADLGRKAKGTSVGLRCLMWRLQAAQGLGPVAASPALSGLVDELLADYLANPDLAQAVDFLGWLGDSMPAEKLNAALAKIEKDAASNDARALAMLVRAKSVFSSESADGKAEGRKLLERVQKEFAGSAAAARAKGQLFEVDHLQIGMSPPDIEATDETGKTFRLYEYRGKVTVVDFWGFW
jgi:hypothetical protein